MHAFVEAERQLIRAIRTWDEDCESTWWDLVDDDRRSGLAAWPPRGVVHDGTLYLAVCHDEDHEDDHRLVVVPMAAIVDLDG